MDSHIIFTKTPKAARAPLPWAGGLSAQSKRVLSHVDGKRSVEEILRVSEKMSNHELHKILLKLEEDGYIKRTLNQQAEPDWLKDVGGYAMNNYSIAVEEIDAAELNFGDTSTVVEPVPETTEKTELNAETKTGHTTEADSESKSSETMEAKAKREAERKAQAEAAQRARHEAAEQAKRIAEASAKARQEVERIEREKAEAARIKAEAEQKAKAEAEEKARLEAERKAHEAAAERARLEAERIAREEAEALARQERERIEQEELAAKARQEAEEQARLEAERIEREKAEAIIKAQAEEAARIKAEAEQKAKAEAEEQARIEAERQAQIAEAERKLREAERIAREELKAQHEAEKKAQAEAEKAARAEAKRFAKEEKAAKARLKAEEKARAKALRGPVMRGKLDTKLLKPLLFAVPLVLVLMVGLIHVMNLPMLITPIEKLATESIGEVVKVREVHAALFPQPGLVLMDVTVGNQADVKIERVNIASGVSMLFSDVKVLDSVEISGVTLTPAEFAQQAQWVNKVAKSGKLKIEEITLEQIAFKLSDLALESMNGKVALTPSGTLANVELANAKGSFTLLLTPQNGNAAVTLTASDWQPPLLAPLVVDEVTATGVISDNQFSLSQVEAKAFGGLIKAQGELRWAGQLSASGNFELVKMTLPRMLEAFGSGASIEGMLNAKATFVSNAVQASALAEAAEVTANFALVNGKVNKVGLSHAVMAGAANKVPQESNFTRFDTFTGNVAFKDGRYEYRQLELKTEQFRARGNLDIAPSKTVSGKISGELVSKTVRRQASFNVGGELADLKLQ